MTALIFSLELFGVSNFRLESFIQKWSLLYRPMTAHLMNWRLYLATRSLGQMRDEFFRGPDRGTTGLASVLAPRKAELGDGHPYMKRSQEHHSNQITYSGAVYVRRRATPYYI